jgi:glycosyltransferase involved in cell wall biosynthesis
VSETGSPVRSLERPSTGRARLSVTVITWNEEARLPACLESVAWANEIVVVDAESGDRTVEVARGYTDHVVVRPWEGFGRQKNFALERTTGDWILSLDADEEVSAELRADIVRVLDGEARADAYAVPRRNIFWGQWVRHGRLYPDWQVRLFRRGHGRFVERDVHESIEVRGDVGRLSGPLVHRSYRDVADFLERTNRYTSLAAAEWVRQGRRAGVRDLVLRPAGRFFSMYVLHRGFADGWRGFLLAALYAYYVLIRSVKIWERSRG